MARYTGAVCRQCRREGMKLFLKGDRCYSGKCALTGVVMRRATRSAPPEDFGYGIQLREAKARRIYGCWNVGSGATTK